MSDNEDLLGDDLGDQSLADYNLGNEEEEQLLADDYDNAVPQNVPTSIGSGYGEPLDMVPTEYPRHVMEYNNPQPLPYVPNTDTECVVPNITVEVPNVPIQMPEHSTYAPYEPPVYDERAVPPAIPAAPIESPQIVPSDVNPPLANGDLGPRERFISERPVGAQRLPQVRDIPDSLDKVVIPRGGFGPRARTSWRNPQFAPRYSHPYRRNNMHRGNFNQRASFPPPHIRPIPPPMRLEMRPEFRPEIRPDIPDIRPDFRPEIRPDIPDIRPEFRPEIRPDMRPDIPREMRPEIRPDMRAEMRIDVRPEDRPEMRPEIHPDIRPEIRPDIRAEIRPDVRPEIRPDIRPEMRPDMRPEIRPDMRPEMRHDMRPDHLEPLPPQMGPEISPERPLLPQEMPQFRNERPFYPRFHFRPDERPPFVPRPNFEQRNFEPRPFFRPNFPPRPNFAPPMREIVPNASHMPQITIRQQLPPMAGPSMDKPKMDMPREPEVRMLPVSLPPNLPPGGLAGKKVLINPHFKGNFQPVEGLPVYIPTRIQKSPPRPLSPTIENKFGPVKDIDDAAERFIAEQRSALARAARKQHARRSPQRYIENTTIEIENELAPRRRDDDDLLRRQEEFIHANRAGLRRRMRSRSLSPPRRSPSPRRSPPRARERHDEDSEYKRRLREQESLRERVLRAKEVRRRKNAVALHKQLQDKEREAQEQQQKDTQLQQQKDTQPQSNPTPKPQDPKPKPLETTKPIETKPTEEVKPDTTRTTPEKERVDRNKERLERERSPVRKDETTIKKEEISEVNSTCDALTPPRAGSTPPLPRADSDDELELILGDIDGILSDDDDHRLGGGTQPQGNSPPAPADLRRKLPPKPAHKPQRQKIVFREEKEDNKKKKEKSPPRRPLVTSSTKADDAQPDTKKIKIKPKLDMNIKSRPRITYDPKDQPKKEKDADDNKTAFTNRRVILQRKITPKESKSVFSRIEIKSDPTKPNPGIFSRAVRTAIGSENTRIVVKKDEPQIQYESDSDIDDESLLEDSGNLATVINLPFGMTDTRLKTLAGNEVQSLILDKEERSAKITFKNTVAAESFKKKFNNKMVAASRLTVTLR